MRAKRSKKYRKIMSSYQRAFSFREPYQILLDAAFIRTCHTFHMPLQKYLENTMHGQCKIFMTKCTLTKVMNEHEKAGGHPRSRPVFLPPPTDLPLRYCKHTNKEGEELGSVTEAQCLLDLLAGQPHGNEVAKNKHHYTLATADALESEQNRRDFVDIREKARLIPGVPIVYVKRSVMILEEMSGTTENTRLRQEKDKFTDGLIGSRKRKRNEGEEVVSMQNDLLSEENVSGQTHRGFHKAKGPNPLSVRRKKVKQATEPGEDLALNSDENTPRKVRRRGKRGKKSTAADGSDGDGGPDLSKETATSEDS